MSDIWPLLQPPAADAKYSSKETGNIKIQLKTPMRNGIINIKLKSGVNNKQININLKLKSIKQMHKLTQYEFVNGV